MAKVIYSMKIYLFRAQFRLTESEKNGLKRIVMFVISKYITAWFNAPLATSAPAQDLEFLKSLLNYPDESVSKATATVFARHLWYLSARLVALAFFDERVTVETKREMVTALQQEGSEDPHAEPTLISQRHRSPGKLLQISSQLAQQASSLTLIWTRTFSVRILLTGRTSPPTSPPSAASSHLRR